MKKIVIYARYSSEKQTEQSIEGQLRVCHEFAERNGYKIIHEYIDRALSGTNDNRPAFQQMIEDSKNKEFEFVLVYKLDRFSRSKYDNAIYKHKLEHNGVRVISATETISNSPEGALMEGLLEMFAEMYVRDLKEKVKRGMRESMIKGNYLGGNLLYGYKVIDKKICIDETKAPAIRYLFEEYAKGKPRKQIVNEINEKGFRTNRGKPFSYNSLQTTLTNQKYIGIFDNGEIQNDSYYPAIVSKDIFDKVQSMMKQNKLAPGKNKAKADYFLSGKAFCGYCGDSIVGVCGTSKQGTVHYYYACSNQRKKHICKKKIEKKADLELEVVRYTQNMLTPENINFIAENIFKQYNDTQTLKQIKEFESQIKKIDNELDKLFNRFIDCKSKEMQNRLNERVESLTLQKEDLTTELKKMYMIQKMQHSKESIISILSIFSDGDINDIEYQKRIIDLFVKCVYVYDDEFFVYYELFDKKPKTTFDNHKKIRVKEGFEFDTERGTIVSVSTTYYSRTFELTKCDDVKKTTRL